MIRDGESKSAKHLIHRVHDADDVSEAVVFGSGKNVVREAELLDPSQPLKEGRVDHLLFPLGDRDESV